MKIGIVGSRTFENYFQMKDFIIETIDIKEVKLIISGGAVGADCLGERFANDNKIEIKIYYPEWKRFGKPAGLIRNSKIVKESDVIFAFWDGRSAGTKDTIDKANGLGKKVHVYIFKVERIEENKNKKEHTWLI